MATKTSAPLDFSNLAPENAELPAQTRERKYRDNPFIAWLAESYESKQGKSVTVPAASAGEVEYLVRRAADELGIGARVIMQDSKGNRLDKEARKTHKGNVRVLFAGKDRKSRKADDDVTTDDSTDSE